MLRDSLVPKSRKTLLMGSARGRQYTPIGDVEVLLSGRLLPNTAVHPM